MAEQQQRGCALLALVAAVAVIAFIGGRLSASWPGDGAQGGAASSVPTRAPAVVAPPTIPGAMATATPRLVAVSAASPAPAGSPTAEPAATRRPRPTATAAPTRAAAATRVATQSAAPAWTRSALASPPAEAGRERCDPSYPTVCIPPPPPVRDCSVTDERNFPVRPPDRHRLDSDNDGIGCEPIR